MVYYNAMEDKRKELKAKDFQEAWKHYASLPKEPTKKKKKGPKPQSKKKRTKKRTTKNVPLTMRQKHHEYLQSELWELKRAEYFRYFPYECMICHDDHGIHLHHKTYERTGGNELLSDLAALCNHHHKELHKYHKGVKNTMTLLEASNQFIDEQSKPQL